MKINNKVKAKKKKNKFFIIVLITVMIFLFIIFKNINNKDELMGNWTIDGITNYKFSGKGRGKLKLPENEYEFIYSIDNGKIHIDYKNEKATDSDYIYFLEDEKIFLKGIKATRGTYELIKQY